MSPAVSGERASYIWDGLVRALRGGGIRAETSMGRRHSCVTTWRKRTPGKGTGRMRAWRVTGGIAKTKESQLGWSPAGQGLEGLGEASGYFSK